MLPRQSVDGRVGGIRVRPSVSVVVTGTMVMHVVRLLFGDSSFARGRAIALGVPILGITTGLDL